MKKKPKTITHGECYIFESSLPKDAVIEKHDKSFVIIADSEVTGTHHVVDLNDGVQFYKSGNRRFIKNSKPTNVRCIVADRHDTKVLNPGVWEIGIQQEFDYFTMSKRNVAD